MRIRIDSHPHLSTAVTLRQIRAGLDGRTESGDSLWMPSKYVRKTADIVGEQPAANANANANSQKLKELEQQIQGLLASDQPVPKTLWKRFLSLVALGNAKGKEQVAMVKSIADLFSDDEGSSVEDVPKEVLLKIADLKTRSITPYVPSME